MLVTGTAIKICVGKVPLAALRLTEFVLKENLLIRARLLARETLPIAGTCTREARGLTCETAACIVRVRTVWAAGAAGTLKYEGIRSITITSQTLVARTTRRALIVARLTGAIAFSVRSYRTVFRALKLLDQ